MSSPALDDRTFENAVSLTAEEQASNAKHFKDKGYDVEVIPEEGDEPPASAPADAVVPPADPAAAPAADQGPAVVEDDTSLDAELQAEAEAKPEVKKLGHHARRTQKIRDLTHTVSAKDLEIAELKGRLAAKPVSPAATLAPVPAAAAAPVERPPGPEPIKAKEFEKPRPAKPELKNFADKDDPYAALAEAAVAYADEVSDWKDEKRAFDQNQQAEVARQTREREQQRTQQTTQEQAKLRKFEEIRREHPDFDTQVSNTHFTPIMLHLLQDNLKDGLKLGYELTKPENAEFYHALHASTETSQDPNENLRMIEEGIQALAVFRHELKKKTAAPLGTAPAVPAAVAPPVQIPPTVPPRREEAAPVPVRGNSVATIRPEDVDPMDSDARRALRRHQAS